MRRLLLAACLVFACYRHAEVPAQTKPCACGAHVTEALDAKSLCTQWPSMYRSHATFPELDPKSCYVPVRYPGARPDPIPEGCGYTPPNLEKEIARYDAIAKGTSSELPLDLRCAMPLEERTRAAAMNATTLRALSNKTFAYAAVSTFGYGVPMQEKTPLMKWRPSDACPELNALSLSRIGQNRERAARAAEAFHAGVAPVITVSGGAVHSPVYETWILTYFLHCEHHVPLDKILVDPCADHTHTNMRNTAGLIVALGGRSAYVVTTGIQVGYMQEWTTWDLIGGSIDQRSLRDFGYLVGSYRQASVGTEFGFWLTPYRFWAEPRDGLGSFTCVR